MGRKRAEAAERERELREARRRQRLLPVVVPLLALGLGCSIYLLHLYVRVRQAGVAVQSFCAVNDTLNCVTVANSTYSTWLGLPIALYGLEFFALLLLGVLLSALGRWRVRAWDSLLLLASLAALPAVALLAWISSVRIGSVCLLCAIVQGTVGLIFLLLIVSTRKELRAALTAGPRELLAWLRSRAGLVGAVVVLGVALSQFFWVPPLLRGSGGKRAPGAWHGLPVSGLTVGPPDAPLRVEEFTDFECPHCGHAHQVMMDVLRRHPGKIHLVHRDFPLDMSCNPLVKREFHPNACRAALYARCAARQDLYWPFEELLFENREQLDERNLRALARRVGLDPRRLDRCLEDPRTLESVQADINEGLRRGITGTPTLFINGEKHVGMQPLSFWEEKLRR